MIRSTLPQAAAGSTVGSLFRDRARLDPDRPAIEAAGCTFTYRQVNERVNRAVDVLREHRDGLDRVAKDLLEKEEVPGKEVLELVGVTKPQTPIDEPASEPISA